MKSRVVKWQQKEASSTHKQKLWTTPQRANIWEAPKQHNYDVQEEDGMAPWMIHRMTRKKLDEMCSPSCQSEFSFCGSAGAKANWSDSHIDSSLLFTLQSSKPQSAGVWLFRGLNEWIWLLERGKMREECKLTCQMQEGDFAAAAITWME